MPAEAASPGGLPPSGPGTVATVGTFDGIHAGHREVLEEIARRGRSRGLRSLLITFDRHPLEVVRPDDAPPLLTTPAEKKEMLALTGLQYVAFLPFTRSLSLYQPEEFVREVLVRRFRVRELVIGYDHGFGRGRSGDTETLRELGRELGFDVDVVEEVDVGRDPVSSTRIRRLLAEGRVERAAECLGRPYSLQGPVVHGMGRGRDLGFPTANIDPPGGRKLIPAAGIYAVRARVRDELRDGILHAGPRPTFGGASATLELYLLDFDRDIYGEPVRVDFLKRLREVRSFSSTDELVAEMRRDRERARAYFEAARSADTAGARRPAGGLQDRDEKI